MGSFWLMWRIRIGVLVVVAAICAGVWYRSHVWHQGYDAAVAARAASDAVALAQRQNDNVVEVASKIAGGNLIERKNDEAMAPVRQRIVAAPSVRPGTGFCGPAQSTKNTGASNSAESGAPARVVRPDVDRDLRALRLTVEEAFATARTCQKKLELEGFGSPVEFDAQVTRE